MTVYFIGLDNSPGRLLHTSPFISKADEWLFTADEMRYIHTKLANCRRYNAFRLFLLVSHHRHRRSGSRKRHTVTQLRTVHNFVCSVLKTDQ